MTGLNYFQWHKISAKFGKILFIFSEVVRMTHSLRQKSPFLFFGIAIPLHCIPRFNFFVHKNTAYKNVGHILFFNDMFRPVSLAIIIVLK